MRAHATAAPGNAPGVPRSSTAGGWGWGLWKYPSTVTAHGERTRRCMRMDTARLVTCDAVYLLLGWEKSCAAKLEHRLALGLGSQIIHTQEG